MERMKAEARFIRAVQYFYLASFYHDVPLVTKTMTLEEANNVTKSARGEVLKYAADELKAVSEILPRHKDLPSSEQGRATAQAALVYLARTYLVMEDFTNAAAACEQIISWGIIRWTRIIRPCFISPEKVVVNIFLLLSLLMT